MTTSHFLPEIKDAGAFAFLAIIYDDGDVPEGDYSATYDLARDLGSDEIGILRGGSVAAYRFCLCYH